MPPQHLREQDFRDQFTTQDAIKACRQAFEGYGAGDIANPPRVETLKNEGGTSHFRLDMPALWPGHFRCRKVIEETADAGPGHLGTRHAWIDLEDLSDGTCIRLDAGHITDLRTGAAGALSLEYLAGAQLQRIAIVGTGRIAHHLALACDSLFDLRELRCTSRDAGNRANFAAALVPQLRCSKLNMTPSIESCLEGVDAVLTAVPTAQPILSSSLLRSIDTVIAIAGDGRTRQLQAEILETRRVIVDVPQQAEKSGEFLYAASTGNSDKIRLARMPDDTVLTLGDAACGRLPGSGGVAYMTGMAAQDLCAAAMIYRHFRS
jgi:alanine dehydrogenase